MKSNTNAKILSATSSKTNCESQVKAYIYALYTFTFNRIIFCCVVYVCMRAAIRLVPLLNFIPSNGKRSLPPAMPVSNVTVMSRAVASPTRAETHTRTYICMLVCAFNMYELRLAKSRGICVYM